MRPARSIKPVRTPSSPTARPTWPVCCWPTAGCCGEPAAVARRSNACGEPTTSTLPCGASPFAAWTEAELAQCGLARATTRRRSVLEMTSREAEVAHLIGQRMTNGEIAAELFITPKAVEYHLGNIYAKLGLKGRQQLRDFLADSRRPAPV